MDEYDTIIAITAKMLREFTITNRGNESKADRRERSIPSAIKENLFFMTTASMKSLQEHALTVQRDSTILQVNDCSMDKVVSSNESSFFLDPRILKGQYICDNKGSFGVVSEVVSFDHSSISYQKKHSKSSVILP